MSDASITADPTGTIQDTALSKVNSVFTNYHQFQRQLFNDGFAATIPKAMESIQLASFAKQSSLQFTLSSSDIEQVNQLSFSVEV